jgi:predicted secreted hydrolase
LQTFIFHSKTSKPKTFLLAILILGLGAGIKLWAADENQYLAVIGPCNLKFPEDHGSHPGYRIEWWYYTGNLRSETGKHYGFQLTFFRSQISPPGAKNSWPNPASRWRTQQVYLAHAAVSDIARSDYRYKQSISRNAIDLAGIIRPKPDRMTIFVKNWSITIGPEFHHIQADEGSFAFELKMIPIKKPVLHGESGYSRKGTTPERASCYYSFTRLETLGTLTLDGRTIAVKGLSWMDHEFSTAPLEPGVVGWDWFSLMLSDKTELMVYLLRQKDGTLNPFSSGTYIYPDGSTRHLKLADFKVDTLKTWKSPHSGARYPSRWRLTVFPLSMGLSIIPNLVDQEIQTKESATFTYWEGSVSFRGTVAKQQVEGRGYVELTGYAKSFAEASQNKIAPYRFPDVGN